MNPGPSILGRRRLRAQPTASISGPRTPSASNRRPYSGKSRPNRPGKPAKPHPAKRRPQRRGRNPSNGRAASVQAASASGLLAPIVATGSLTRTPATSARFRRFSDRRRNLYHPQKGQLVPPTLAPPADNRKPPAASHRQPFVGHIFFGGRLVKPAGAFRCRGHRPPWLAGLRFRAAGRDHVPARGSG